MKNVDKKIKKSGKKLEKFENRGGYHVIRLSVSGDQNIRESGDGYL
jgi:hypothetical protein